MQDVQVFGFRRKIQATIEVAESAAAGGPFAGGASNPLNYPVTRIRLGNGQGCFSMSRDVSRMTIARWRPGDRIILIDGPIKKASHVNGRPVVDEMEPVIVLALKPDCRQVASRATMTSKICSR